MKLDCTADHDTLTELVVMPRRQQGEVDALLASLGF